MKLVDLTGQRFGRLMVKRRHPERMYRKHVAWQCDCDCGDSVVTTGSSLRRGVVNSCGCLRRNDHEDITYEGAHWRIKQAKGVASAHPCVDCGKPAQQWSYDYSDSTEFVCSKRAVLYSLDPDRYQPRCASCHKLHDNHRPRRNVDGVNHDVLTK